MKKYILFLLISFNYSSCQKKNDESIVPNTLTNIQVEKDFIRAKLSNGEEYVVYGSNIDGTQIIWSGSSSAGDNTTGFSENMDDLSISVSFNDIYYKDFDTIRINRKYPLYNQKTNIYASLKYVGIGKSSRSTYTSLYDFGVASQSNPDIEYDINKYYHVFTKIERNKGEIGKIYGYLIAPTDKGVDVEITYKTTN